MSERGYRRLPVLLRPILPCFLFTAILAASAHAEARVLVSYHSPSEPEGIDAEAGARMSPDGRWLVYWVAVGEEDAELRLLNLTTGSVRKVRLHPYCLFSNTVLWRPDSRAVAVSTTRGMVLLNRRGRIVSWINQFKKPLAAPGDWETGCYAWSSTTGRLAAFDSYGVWTVWNGDVTRKMPNWMRATNSPSDASDRTWQCAWSPDEKHVYLRYYGMSGERSYPTSVHLSVLDTRTGQAAPWGAEAGPAAWVNSRQLFYRADTPAGATAPLMLGNPNAGKEALWKNDVAAYAVSTDRAAIYAVDSHGNVSVSPTGRRRWKLICRLAANYDLAKSSQWALTAMPNGFVACIGEDVKNSMRYTLTAWRGGKVVDRYSASENIALIGWSPARKAFLIAPHDDRRAAIREFAAFHAVQ